MGMDLVCIWGDICKTCMAFVYACLGQKGEERSEGEFKCLVLEEQEGEQERRKEKEKKKEEGARWFSKVLRLDCSSSSCIFLVFKVSVT